MKKTSIFPQLNRISFLILFLIIPQISYSAIVFQAEESSIEISYSRFHLKTTDNLSTAPGARDSGSIDGARIIYTHTDKESQLFYKFFIEQWEEGTTDFKGFNMLSAPQGVILTPEILEVGNKLKTYELQLGLVFKRGLNKLPFDVTLYTGYGYHQWERAFRANGGSAAFKQEYTWNYVPVGFKLNYNLTGRLSVGLDVTAKLTTKAGLTADLHGAAGNGLKITASPRAKLGRRVGGRVEIPFIFKAANTKHWSYIFAPWVDIMQTVEKDTLKFHEESTDADYYWTEPAIERVSTGIAIGIYRNF